MSASSAASNLPASGRITQAQATEILSHYSPVKVQIPEEESHLYNLLVEPSHHSWDYNTCIGRLKQGSRAAPSVVEPLYAISTVGSNLAFAYHGSKVPFSVNANRSYFVDKPEDDDLNAPFMLFTVADGVYVATDKDNGAWATNWLKKDTELHFGRWRSQSYDWSMAQFAFHSVKEKDGEADTVEGQSL